MKREDLIKLGMAEDVVDKIMALHGSDIETHKSKLATAQAELDGLKSQIKEAGEAIEGFKKLDIEGVKKSADEWKAKAEAAEKDAQAKIQALKFEHALDGALTGAKAKNAKAVRALLEMDGLKLNEADGAIIGLEDQLKKIKESNDYLFDSETPTPRVVAGGGNHPVGNISAFEAAARKGAGLPIPEGK